ncbi:hypothetical protein Bca52824_031906 [Brassica carinata]|uniref:Replication factor A C-terminal domain-containing protein n=1 Tax=Brassica carinata TaxID=52824 RepID=A0A8X7V4N2_BRACI|nr:hypothetical protein Bca52824_031906 [Brassica carinata]
MVLHCLQFLQKEKCYYLVVRVSDKSKGEAKFLLFNNIAEKLIRRPAFELLQEAAQQNPYFLPQSLTDLIGRRLLFKITIGGYGQKEQNVVDDIHLIQHFDPHRTEYLSGDGNPKEMKKVEVHYALMSMNYELSFDSFL